MRVGARARGRCSCSRRALRCASASSSAFCEMKPWPTSFCCRSTTRSCCSQQAGEAGDLGGVGARLDLEVRPRRSRPAARPRVTFLPVKPMHAGDAARDLGADRRVDHVLERADDFLVDLERARLRPVAAVISTAGRALAAPPCRLSFARGRRAAKYVPMPAAASSAMMAPAGQQAAAGRGHEPAHSRPGMRSRANSSSTVSRRRTRWAAAALDQHFGGARPGVVVRAHRHAVRARRHERQQVALAAPRGGAPWRGNRRSRTPGPTTS